MIQTFKGELNLPEINLNELTYLVVRKINKKVENLDDVGITSFNLTDFLKKVQGKEIGLAVEFAGMDIFNEVGKVYLCDHKTFINDVCLEQRLWDYTGMYIKIIIDDLEEES
jgi:hypothetical protein